MEPSCSKASLHKRLKGLMGEYADLREQLRTEYVEVVSRKMFTVTGEKPDTDAVERMIESGESEAIFQKATLTSGRGHIMSVLEDVVATLTKGNNSHRGGAGVV